MARTAKEKINKIERLTGKPVHEPCGNGCPWPWCLTNKGECEHGCGEVPKYKGK